MPERVKVQVGDICWLDPTASGNNESGQHCSWPQKEQAYPFLIIRTSDKNGVVGNDPIAIKKNAPWVTEAISIETGFKLKENLQTGSSWSNLWFRKDEFLTAAYRANKPLDAGVSEDHTGSCPNPPQP